MKIIKVIGSIAAIVFLVIVFGIYFLPSTAHMERSMVMNATPAEVYRDLITFRNFNAWSPWADKDPEAAYIFEGPDFGVGARIMWKSDNPDLGNGSMKIVEADSNKMVRSTLTFDEYGSTPYGTFYLEEVPEGTKVTWAYDEDSVSGFGKIFMMGIDGFLGRDWETALSRLKERVESAPEFSTLVKAEIVPSFRYVGINDTSLNDPALISTKMAQSYGELMTFFAKNHIEPAGYPIAVYTFYDEYEVSFICGIPISSAFNESGTYPIFDSYKGLVIKSTYMGDYSGLEVAHEEIQLYASFYKYEIGGNPWEEYITGPKKEPDPSKWKTFVYYPVR